MADMHPHRRAQLELEAAQQAARGPPVQKSANELAAAELSMRATATGANMEPAGAFKREQPAVSDSTPFMRSPPREPRAMRVQKVSRPAMNVSNISKVTATQRKKFLRAQIKEADRAENYNLAQNYFDELAAIKTAWIAERAANKNDPARLAQRANRKAAKAGRRHRAMADGTYVTPSDRRAMRDAKLEVKRQNDPVWAAQEAPKMEAKLAKQEEDRATTAVVARYASYRQQHPETHVLEPNPHLDQEQQMLQYHIDHEQPPIGFATSYGQQASLHTSYRSHGPPPSLYNDRQPEHCDSNRLESDYARCEEHRQQLLTRHERLQTSLSRKMERIDLDGQSYDGASSDDDSDFNMGGVALPLSTSHLGQSRYNLRSCSNIKTGSDALSLSTSYRGGSRYNSRSFSPKPDGSIGRQDFQELPCPARDVRRIIPSNLPMLEAVLPGQQDQDIRRMHGEGSMGERDFEDVPHQARDIQLTSGSTPKSKATLLGQQDQNDRRIHGDGSKPFLDPDSTAYKMMSRMGWAQGRGLGKDEGGLVDPIKAHLRPRRKGLQETRDTNTAPRGAQWPFLTFAAPSGIVPKPVASLNQTSSNHLVDNKRSVIDLTQGETEDAEINAGPDIIDLTQDIFVDLTLDDDDDDGNAMVGDTIAGGPYSQSKVNPVPR